MPSLNSNGVRSRPAAHALLCCIAVFASGISLGAELPTDCHAIVDPTGRLLCYDRVTGRPDRAQTPATNEPPATAVSAGQEPESAAASRQAETSTGTDGTAMQAPSSRGLPAPIQPPVEVPPAKLVKLERTSIGRYRFHLENGEVWEQLEAGRVAVREGDTVSVKEGRLGNWILRASNNKSRSVRVRRFQ